MTPRTALPVVVASWLVALVAVFLFPADLRDVAIPLCTGIATAVSFIAILVARSVVLPMGEIGAWFVGAVVVYLVLPLVVYVVLGGQYTPLNDARLFALQPTARDVASAAWLYVAFLISFCGAYLLVRANSEPARTQPTAGGRQLTAVMVGVWVTFTLVALAVVPRISSETYAGQYAALAALPLGIRQAIKLWQGWSIILALAIRVRLFRDFANKKWIIAAWLLYDVLTTLAALGSRTNLVLSLGSCFVLYHLFVRPIRFKYAMAFGVTGLAGFLALGLLREARGVGAAVTMAPGGIGGEFEALFANVVDLRQRFATGEMQVIPIGFHFSDFAAIFPSQIFPFQKVDLAVWYETTFYPVAAEQGFASAFGVIAQGVIGLGAFELVIRGVALGVGFAMIHRYFSRHSHRFWIVVFYVWMTMWSYQSFRNTSFIMLSYVIQQFIPLVLLIEGLRRLLGASSQPAVAQGVRASGRSMTGTR